MIIALCDDDRTWLEKASLMLHDYAAGHDLELQTICFENGDSLLKYDLNKVEAVLMDINLKRETGIEVAGRVNAIARNCKIIYCTDYVSFASDVYETDHIYFVLKEEFAERMDRIMEKILIKEDEDPENDEIYYHVIGQGMTCFKVSEIFYFERRTRFTLVFTASGSYKIREKISELADAEWSGSFTRCHTSYLVAFDQILKKDKNVYILKCGARIPISRRYMKQTKDEFLHWCEKQMY